MDQHIRINKFLQAAGICSRRGADELIRDGRVTVDGAPAELGQMIEGKAIVCVDDKPVRLSETGRVLLAVNKPVGIVCTEDPREKDNIISFLHYPSRITYAGRLDKRSSGLLLMTNDGDLIERMMRGRHAHEKEYIVTVDRDLRDEDLEQMSRGVSIEIDERRSEPGGRQKQTGNRQEAVDHIRQTRKRVTTRPCDVQRLSAREFRIILTQGLNRQIRRMCAHFDYRVVSLVRVRVMNIRLGDLAPGAYRDVTQEEIAELEQLLEDRGNGLFGRNCGEMMI